MPDLSAHRTTPPRPEDAGVVATELLTAMTRLTRWAGRRSSIDVPIAQLRVLSQLDDLGPSRISTLAAVDRCAQPTMSVLVRRLEDRGWVRREPDPTDTRACLVSLNSHGRQALLEARSAAGDPLARRLRASGPEEVGRAADAVALLRRLLTDPADPEPADPARATATTGDPA